MAQTFPLPSSPGKPPQQPGPDYKPFPGEIPTPPKYAKGGAVETACYAQGGAVLGRTRDFMKEPDPFTARSQMGDNAGFKKMKPEPGDPQDYVKKGKGEQGRDKSLKTVMPRA
jgi:hypothetical protein